MYRFDPGQRVLLVFTDDQYTLLRPGATGTVVEDHSSAFMTRVIYMKWDDGSNLSMIPESGDLIVPLDVNLTQAEASHFDGAMKVRNISLPDGYELYQKVGISDDGDFDPSRHVIMFREKVSK